MNQIINIDLNKNIDNSNTENNPNNLYNIPSKKKMSKKTFNVQFFLSIIAIIIITIVFLYYKITLNNEESFANLLINNYSITKLYSNNNNDNNSNKDYSNESLPADTIIGIIEIPTLNVSYTIFNGLDDELLKTSPCKFYGDFPNSNNTDNLNLCIAGHNYDNNKFFSNIKDLNINDKIILHDNFDNKYMYSVVKNYEVKSDDLSPVYTTITDSYELTLVTCNNLNKNRIIIKAKIEDE